MLEIKTFIFKLKQSIYVVAKKENKVADRIIFMH
jgi:hypothetical protein